jgi:GDP-4-dehydro-6-deoxy-D-mannose reductase
MLRVPGHLAGNKGFGARGMTANALIIGGTGFVGPNLARQLSDRYDVVATGRECDIRDADALRQTVRKVDPAIVVNLAAITTVRESFERPQETYDIGFSGLFGLLNALAAAGFSGRFLQVGSSEVYGHPAPDQLPLVEASPVRPLSPYAVAKVAGELLCGQWSRTGAFDIVMARPFTHIGPGQSSRFSIASFSHQIAQIMLGGRKGAIEVGALHATRDLTDVRDTVRAYDVMLHEGRNGQVYNVCSGREVLMMDVLRELIRLSGCEVEIVQNPALVRAAEQSRLLGSYAALEAATGWKPNYTLTETLSDILAHLTDSATANAGSGAKSN